ncbi:TPA: Ig-like domain-containing protein, partial [Enterobacter cloacae]
TDDNTPTYRGKGEANGTAIIDLGNGTTVRVPVDDKGNWSYTPAPALADGDYTWKVSIEDKAGNVGPASDPIHFIVDTSRNGVSISHVVDDQGDIVGNLGSGSHTDDTTPTVVGRATAGALVNVYVDGKYIDSVRADAITGAWQYTLSPALTADATYKITASEDAGAGESAQTAPFELTLDTRVPTGSLDRVADDVGLVQGDLANPAVTDDTTPTLYGKGVAGDVVFIYDGTRLLDSVTVGPANTWNYTLPQQNNGTELSLTAVFQSPTGVKSAPTAAWNLTIDTEAPNAPVITGMYDDAGTLIADGGRSRDTTPELRGTAEKNSLVKIYGPDSKEPIASVYADANGNWTWTSPVLSDAKYDFYVKAQDKAGNVSGESNHYGLEVDTQAATPVILGAYDNVEGGIYNGLVPNGGLSNDASMELRGTAEANSIVYIYNAYNDGVLDTVKADANGNWSWSRSVGNTAAGRPHMFYTIAKDDLGNVSGKSATYSLNVDTVNNAPVITGSWDDVQGGAYNGLVGNGGVTNDRTLDLRGTAEAGSVVYIINPASGGVYGSVTAGVNGQWSFPLTTNYNKTYDFQAYSVDKAGNRSVNSTNFAITVDTVVAAPNVTVISDNVTGGKVGNLVDGERTNDNRPTITGNGAEPGAKIEIVLALGSQGWTSGTNLVYTTTAKADGTWSLEIPKALQDGTWYFRANQTDLAGNKSGLGNQHYVVVDTVNAAPTITSVTDNVGNETGNVANFGKTDDSTPTLNGTAEAGSTVYIAVNGATYSTVATNGNWSFTPPALPLGNHTFSIFSIDQAGNRSAGGSRTLTVIAPTTSGSENFNALANTYLTIGKPTSSGFTLLSGSASVSTTVSGAYYSNPFLYIEQGTKGTTFTVGETNNISFQLMGWGGYGGGLGTTAYVKFYNAAGKEIGSLSGVGRSSTDYVNFNFAAPAGETIAKVHIYSNDTSGLGLDNLTWGTQVASRSAGRSVSMLMNTEEQHDDNASVVSTLNGHEINLDNLQHKTIDLTNSKQDKLNISLNDVLTHAEKDLFIADGNKQMMVQGNKGDVVNLSDLLPDNSDPGNWTNAGNVKVSGVEYQVYQVENLDVELLVQNGVTVNVNNH